jgi:hypothetical protein
MLRKKQSRRLNNPNTARKLRYVENVDVDGIKYELIPNKYFIILSLMGEYDFKVFSVPSSDEYLKDESVRKALEEGLICRKDIELCLDSKPEDVEKQIARKKLINMMGVCLCIDYCFEKEIHGAWEKYLVESGGRTWSNNFLDENYRVQVMKTDIRKTFTYPSEIGVCITTHTPFHRCVK